MHRIVVRPVPQLVVGVGDRPDSPQGAISFCICYYDGFAKCWGGGGAQENEREYGQTCTHLGR